MNSAYRYERLLRAATYSAVAVVLVLITVKAVAWGRTGSVSLLASLVDSMMDGLVSLINLVAMRIALTPADREHRFGHGKAEAIAGLAQSAFIAGSALFLLFHAFDRAIHPRALAHVDEGLWVMIISIVLTSALLAFQYFVIRRTGSSLIKADSLHYKSDLLSNIGVLLSLWLASSWSWVDPLAGALIGLYILASATGIARGALSQLMDRELPAELQAQIMDISRAQPGVLGVHDLRTRQSGQARFVQLHLELDASQTLASAHAIADAVEIAISAAIDNAEVIVHQDPQGFDDRRDEWQ